jgi:hypothetical protein
MAKNCVITLDPDVVDKAAENAQKHGKSLKEVIEGTIIDMAENDEGGDWITEKALEGEPWAPSRVALWQMRKNGRLEENKHYKRQGRFIYYNKVELQKILAPATAAPATPTAEAAV